MSEVITEVHTFKVEMMCDINGCKGKMLFTGRILTTYPGLHIHQCDTCFRTENYRDISYPAYRHYPEVE